MCLCIVHKNRSERSSPGPNNTCSSFCTRFPHRTERLPHQNIGPKCLCCETLMVYSMTRSVYRQPRHRNHNIQVMHSNNNTYITIASGHRTKRRHKKGLIQCNNCCAYVVVAVIDVHYMQV